MRKFALALFLLVGFATQALAAVSSNSVVTPQIPTMAAVQFLAASGSASSIAANSATSATGTITGNLMTLTAGLSGTFVAGATLSGTGVANNVTVVQQLSGTAGGLGTYQVTGDRAQSVVSTTITATYGVLTVGGTVAGTWQVGGQITGTGVVTTGAGTFITQAGTGTGGAGTYYVNNATVVASTALTQDAAGTYKTLYTGGYNGSKCLAMNLTTSDATATHLVTAQLVKSGSLRRGGVTVITTLNSGFANAVPSIDMMHPSVWTGLPVDSDGNEFFYLTNQNDSLQVTFATALTSATAINVVIMCADF